MSLKRRFRREPPTLFYGLLDQLDDLLGEVAIANNNGLIAPEQIEDSLGKFLGELKCGWCKGLWSRGWDGMGSYDWVCPHCDAGVPRFVGKWVRA